MSHIRLPGTAARVLVLLAATFLAAPAAAESSFDDASGKLRLPADARWTWGVETTDGFAGLELAAWAAVDNTTFTGEMTRTVISADTIVPFRTTAPSDAVEGSFALRLGEGGTGLVVSDPALWSSLAGSRFEVVAWVRVDGAEPDFALVYDQDPDTIWKTWNPFALVRAIRTGRETSDGWVEMSTGPVDGSVWGIPVRGVQFMPSGGSSSSHFLIDALEVRAVPGAITPAGACSQSNVDAVCGPAGECMYGRCVPDTVVWGPLPPVSHRHEIVERWVHWVTHIMGDQKAVDAASTTFVPAARALADSATTPRQFFGGMSNLVNLLRDNHTSFGGPWSPIAFSPVTGADSAALGACFGVVDKDLLDGKRGYAVFKAAAAPITGTPLAVGDVLVAIDGVDADTWLDANWARYEHALPNDPAADPTWKALSIGSLVSQRASTVTLLRCASSTACDNAHRQSITIDLATVLGPRALTATGLDDPQAFSCSARFKDFVSGAHPDDIVDSVLSAVDARGTAIVQFDGFDGDAAWDSAMIAAFATSPKTVVLDARHGHGGYLRYLETLLGQVCDPSDPFGYVTFERLSYERTDPARAFGACIASGSKAGSCVVGSGAEFFPSVAAPPGGASKIAWLQSYDVSTNDFAARMMKARKGSRIFGPNPTSGAYGARQDLPPLVPNWYGGAIQIEDTRFATNASSIASAPWESGHGVEPDVVVAQKLSDALGGVDTIFAAASQWLSAQ